MISANSVLRRNDAMVFEDLGNELMIRDAGSSKVHVLNSTARAVFLRLDGATSLEVIAREVGAHYGRDILGDVLELASALEAKQLLIAS